MENKKIENDADYLKRFIITRLNAMPPNISFSIGNYGSFTRDELIKEVEKGSNVGKATTELELKYLRKLPQLAKMME